MCKMTAALRHANPVDTCRYGSFRLIDSFVDGYNRSLTLACMWAQSEDIKVNVSRNEDRLITCPYIDKHCSL